MNLFGISICATVVVLTVAVFKRQNRRVLVASVLALLAITLWLSTRYATAYRDLGSPPAKDLVQSPNETWRLGACEMNRLIIHSYVHTS